MSAPTPIPDWAREVALETFPYCGMESVREDLAQAIANAWQADTQTLRCAYCGAAHPPGTPESQHELLSAHIRVCAKHPMREVEQDLATMATLIEDHLSFHSYVPTYPLLANALAAYWRKHPRT